MEKSVTKTLRFDRQFRAEFCQVFKKYFLMGSGKSTLLLLLISLCTWGSVRSIVALNENNKNFFNALSTFNAHAAFTNSYQYLIIILAMVLANGYSSYFVGLLTIHWRRLTTNQYLTRWLEQRKYYFLKLGLAKTDNPDQRIAADLEEFPNLSLFIFPLLLSSILTLLSFGTILWRTSIPIPLGSSHFKIHGLFFLCALIVSISGTWISSLIGKKLPSLNYEQEKYNANFRSDLIKLQEASEEIALYQGEKVEQQKIGRAFLSVIGNSLAINKQKKRLTFFSTGFNQISVAIGSFIAAPFYFTKQIDMGTSMLVTGAFAYTTNSFSIFVQVYQALTQWRAALHRIAEFDNVLLDSNLTKNAINNQHHDQIYVELNQLQIYTPEGSRLFNPIDLKLYPARSYLIKGPTGTGKSTLFKAIANMWPYGSGTVNLPHNLTMLFLPQRPYLFEDTLLANLLYPNHDNIDRSDISLVLQEIGLGYLKDQLDRHSQWHRILSLGQQQLLGFARILLQRPNIIFLDEATSALDEPTQLSIYYKLRQALPNAIILSIGHRASLDQLHHQILLVTDGFLRVADMVGRPAVVSEADVVLV